MIKLNLTNLYMSDVDQFDNLKEIQRGSIACPIDGVCLRPMKSDGEKYMVSFTADSSSPDPKVHFRNYADAESFYNFIMTLIAEAAEKFHSIDVLEFNAI